LSQSSRSSEAHKTSDFWIQRALVAEQLKRYNQIVSLYQHARQHNALPWHDIHTSYQHIIDRVSSNGQHKDIASQFRSTCSSFSHVDSTIIPTTIVATTNDINNSLVSLQSSMPSPPSPISSSLPIAVPVTPLHNRSATEPINGIPATPVIATVAAAGISNDIHQTPSTASVRSTLPSTSRRTWASARKPMPFGAIDRTNSIDTVSLSTTSGSISTLTTITQPLVPLTSLPSASHPTHHLTSTSSMTMPVQSSAPIITDNSSTSTTNVLGSISQMSSNNMTLFDATPQLMRNNSKDNGDDDHTASFAGTARNLLSMMDQEHDHDQTCDATDKSNDSNIDIGMDVDDNTEHKMSSISTSIPSLLPSNSNDLEFPHLPIDTPAHASATSTQSSDVTSSIRVNVPPTNSNDDTKRSGEIVPSNSSNSINPTQMGIEPAFLASISPRSLRTSTTPSRITAIRLQSPSSSATIISTATTGTASGKSNTPRRGSARLTAERLAIIEAQSIASTQSPSSVIVFSPVKADRRTAESLGSSMVVSPVRRSTRTSIKGSTSIDDDNSKNKSNKSAVTSSNTKQIEQQLQLTGYAYAPNPHINRMDAPLPSLSMVSLTSPMAIPAAVSRPTTTTATTTTLGSVVGNAGVNVDLSGVESGRQRMALFMARAKAQIAELPSFVAPASALIPSPSTTTTSSSHTNSKGRSEGKESKVPSVSNDNQVSNNMLSPVIERKVKKSSTSVQVPATPATAVSNHQVCGGGMLSPITERDDEGTRLLSPLHTNDNEREQNDSSDDDNDNDNDTEKENDDNHTSNMCRDLSSLLPFVATQPESPPTSASISITTVVSSSLSTTTSTMAAPALPMKKRKQASPISASSTSSSVSVEPPTSQPRVGTPMPLTRSRSRVALSSVTLPPPVLSTPVKYSSSSSSSSSSNTSKTAEFAVPSLPSSSSRARKRSKREVDGNTFIASNNSWSCLS
jgi:hypothetical protein